MSSSDDDHKLTGVSDGTPAPRVLDVDAQPLADANVSPSSDRRDHPRSGRPPRLSDRLFHTDDIQPPQPSPPYKRVASSSHLPLEYSADSPAYRSDQDLPLMPEREYVDEKANSAGHKQKPSVHYPDDVAAPTYRSRAPTLPMHDPDNPLGPSPLRNNHGRQESVATDFASDYGSDEEYDWSADEDLGEEEAKFEHRMGKKMRPKGWFRRLLAMLFGSLLGTVIVAGLLVTGPILIYKFWYQTNPTEHRRFVSDNINAWFFWAAANVLISWWLALIVDLIPSTARWLVSAFWGHVSETVKTNLELYNSVDDNIKPVTYAASGWVSWIIIFENIYELHSSDDDVPSRAPYTNRLSEVVEFLFFLALVWCIQRMASHAIAFAFHRVAFKERVSDLRNRLMVVEHLRDYRPKKRRTHNGARTPMSAFLSSGISPTAEKTFNWTTGTDRSHAASPSGTISDSEFGGDDEAASPNSKTKGKGTQNRPSVPRKSRLSKLFDSQQSRSASRGASPSGEGMSDAENDSPHRYPPSGAVTPPQRGSEDDLVVHAAKALKNAVLHDARNIQGRDATDTGLAWDVSSTSEAKRLARQIFKAFRDRRRSYLLPQDLEPAYSTPEEAQEAFRVFDEDNNGDVSREEIKRMLIKTYKERRFLSRSMRDVSNALHTLNLLLFVLAIIILFLIALPVFGVDISKSLTSFYSIAIAASFIFKSSAASMFDAVMFIFVTHPFDTGDRCFIGKENLIVKKMGLFATVFTRADGVETYYFNSQLFNMFITNCRRSDKTSETITMQMEWRTPIEKIKALEDALNDWLAHEENRWFVPSTTIVFQNFQLQRYLEVSIGISHNGNWQDWGLRNTRRTAFQAAVQHYCLQLGIRAYKPAIPVRWADPSTGIPNSPVPSAMDLPPSPMTEAQPGGGDEYAAPDMHEGALAGGQTAAGGGQTSQAQRAQAATANIAAAQKTAWLGFTPHGEGAQVRARKSKSKKPQGLDGSL